MRSSQRQRRHSLLLAVATLLAAVVLASCNGKPGQPAGGNELSQPSESSASANRKSWAGTKPAPALPTGLTWFNVTNPLTLPQLRGKVVLLDFWTLGCINCQHIIPDLKQLETEFGDALVVIGVHSGKYATEHEDDSVREAVQRYGLQHPVINDPDFAVWDTYAAHAWPTLILIDPAGNLVGRHAGEGVYPLFQPIVASLISEFEAKGVLSRKPLPIAPESTATPTLLSYPGKVLADEAGGRLLIADSGHNRILIAGLDGALRSVIGTGKEGFADGAPAESAFRQPQGLALSPDGATLYVADTRNHAIRAITLATGETTTIAGTGKQAERFPARDAKAKQTALSSPWDLTQVANTLYVSMAGIHQIWAIDLKTGGIAVIAGTSREGIDDGDARTQATLAQPSGITHDDRYLYWVDPESSAVRRLGLAPESQVETMVGTGLFDYGNDDGTGKAARLQHPQGITIANGTIYVADTYNHEIRSLNPASFELKTIAGTGSRGWQDAPGQIALFDEPSGLSAANGRLYVADTNNHLIRTVDLATGSVTTLTLSNIAVATATEPGRALKVAIPPADVAPGGSTLRLTVTSPAGYHLNAQAPSRITLASSNTAVIALGESKLEWASDDPQVTLSVPLILTPGTATITATASVYYCRTGGESLCFIQNIEATAPVSVTPSSSNGEIAIPYLLPESDN